MKTWKDCKNILCIRADNMGDVLMSGPAIRALRNFTAGKITLLTSAKGAHGARLTKGIDEIITFDLPWVKTANESGPYQIHQVLKILKQSAFDGCVVFTVYSQNPLPAVMLAYMAGIPLRLAYCRENPYALLTHWVPETEPYELVKHQVQRDLDLVATLGAEVQDKRMRINLCSDAWLRAAEKIKRTGFNPDRPFLILHPGASEPKRLYPEKDWIKLAKILIKETGMQVLLTGCVQEKEITGRIEKETGTGAFSVSGLLTITEFAGLIKQAGLVISVNTGTVHLASALQRPVLVLYAQSNPQHTPWMTRHVVIPFSIANQYKSKNKVIEFVHDKLYQKHIPAPDADEILKAAVLLLSTTEQIC